MARAPRLVMTIALLLTEGGCGKVSPDSAPAKDEVAPAGMEVSMAGTPATPDSPPKTPPPDAPTTVTGAKAGSVNLFFDWDKDAEKLIDKAVGLVGKKQYPEALRLITGALGKQPDNLSVLYTRAYVQALAGQADAALRDLEVLLYTHYSKFAYKVATDSDLEALRKPPYKDKLDALVKAAKAETVAAWKTAIPFIAASRKPMTGCDRLKGGPEVYGYVPETGRFVAFTYLGDGGAVGFLKVDAVSQLVLVAAETTKGVANLDNLQVQFLDLRTGDVLSSVVATMGPGTKSYRLGTPPPRTPASDRAAEAPMPEGEAVGEGEGRSGANTFLVEVLEGNRVRVKFSAPYAKEDPSGKGDLTCFTLTEGKAAREGGPGGGCEDPPKPPKVLTKLELGEACKLNASLPYFKNIQKVNGTLAVGGKDVVFPCGGFVWASPDGSKAVVKPVPGCPNQATPGGRKGLWLVDGNGTFTDLSPEGDAHQVLWYGNDHAVVQMGLGVGVVDAAKKKYLKVGTPAGSIRGLAVPGF